MPRWGPTCQAHAGGPRMHTHRARARSQHAVAAASRPGAVAGDRREGQGRASGFLPSGGWPTGGGLDDDGRSRGRGRADGDPRAEMSTGGATGDGGGGGGVEEGGDGEERGDEQRRRRREIWAAPPLCNGFLRARRRARGGEGTSSYTAQVSSVPGRGNARDR